MSCQKCGFNQVIGRWHVANYHAYKSPSCDYYSRLSRDATTEGEHLHYTCRCGWEWAGPPKDAQP